MGCWILLLEGNWQGDSNLLNSRHPVNFLKVVVQEADPGGDVLGHQPS